MAYQCRRGVVSVPTKKDPHARLECVGLFDISGVIRSWPDCAVLNLFRKVGKKWAVPLIDHGHPLCRDIFGKSPRGLIRFRGH